MSELERIYKNNSRLDNIFSDKYEKSEPEMFEKNCLEFLTELGEFANETKIFKYWSIKKPDKEEMLEEFADCITMGLYFFNYLNLELADLPKHQEIDNTLVLFNYLFSMGSKLMANCNEELVKDLFVNLMYLGSLLNFEESDIIKAIDNKHKKIEDRLNSDY